MTDIPTNRIVPLSLAAPSLEVLAEIASVEAQTADTVDKIVSAKLTFDDISSLKYADKDLIRTISEHAIATNTLKHVLHKARDNRIKQIKKGK